MKGVSLKRLSFFFSWYLPWKHTPVSDGPSQALCYAPHPSSLHRATPGIIPGDMLSQVTSELGWPALNLHALTSDSPEYITSIRSVTTDAIGYATVHAPNSPSPTR